MSESRGNACIHYAEREQARPKVNLGQAHRKHSYQLILRLPVYLELVERLSTGLNELKMSHITVSLIYSGLQLVINLGFVFLCPVLSAGMGMDIVLVHWLYLVIVVLLVGLMNLAFRKKYYHLHEEYLASLKK